MDDQECRICGCTELNACFTAAGPCSWFTKDLCSACFEKMSLEEQLELLGSEKEFPLRNEASLIRTAEGVLFSRAAPGSIPILTDPEVEIDDVLEAYGDALETIADRTKDIIHYESQLQKPDGQIEYRHPICTIIDTVKHPDAMEILWDQMTHVGKLNLKYFLGYYSEDIRQKWFEATK